MVKYVRIYAYHGPFVLYIYAKLYVQLSTTYKLPLWIVEKY